MSTVKELTDLNEVYALYPVFNQMYPDLPQDEFEAVIPGRMERGFRVIAVFDAQGKPQAVAGFWIGYRFYCKKFIQIDSMVADEARTVKGCGKMLLDFVKEEGRKHGCKRVLLDTFVENYPAHKLFMREGFVGRGYHYNFDL